MSLQSSKEAVDDPLWKSVLEQTFVHFLTFFFSEADKIFDLSKKFVYLDKELQSMFPPKPHNKGVRYVDKLVRVAARTIPGFMSRSFLEPACGMSLTVIKSSARMKLL